MDHAARRRLSDLLDRELVAAQRLTETLTAERNALTGDSPETLKEAAREKIHVLSNIEDLEVERRVLWGSGADLGEDAEERWRALLAIMAQCRNANEVNGHILHIRQHHVRQLFDIARGGATVTYGPRGKTFAGTPRALARA